MLYQVGDTLGDYRILKELGEGTFGKVYLVEWLSKRGKKLGALKILKNPQLNDILKEVSTWAQVSRHPNVLTFITAMEYDKQVFLISECATDGNLQDWIKAYAGKQESTADAARLMLGLLCGLEHLHENDIVHRDIKPANILLKDNIPLLADFGLARGLDLVQSSVLAGTILYMSPELINGWFNHGLEAIRYERSEADDLWAAAVVFYQMLTGDLPFKSPDEIRFSDPATLPEYFLNLTIGNVVIRALQKDISQRYKTAKEMGDDLKRARADWQKWYEWYEELQIMGKHAEELSRRIKEAEKKK